MRTTLIICLFMILQGCKEQSRDAVPLPQAPIGTKGIEVTPLNPTEVNSLGAVKSAEPPIHHKTSEEPQRVSTIHQRLDLVHALLQGNLPKKKPHREDGIDYYDNWIKAVDVLDISVVAKNNKARLVTLYQAKNENWLIQDFGTARQICTHTSPGGAFTQTTYVIVSGPLAGIWVRWQNRAGSLSPDPPEVVMATPDYIEYERKLGDGSTFDCG